MFNLKSKRMPFEPNLGEWRVDPWPHSISMHTYDYRVYRKLRDYFPPEEWTSVAPNNFPLKQGIVGHDVTWEQYLRVSPPWAEYYEYLCGVRFYDHVMSHIGRRLEQNYPELTFKFNCMIRPDMYFFRFFPGLCLELHRDSAYHVMSWVSYFDSPKGGEFVLGDNHRPRYYSPKENMSLLWLNEGCSWHGVTNVETTRCMCYIALNHRDHVWEPTWKYFTDRPALPPRCDFEKAPNASPLPQAL